MGNNTSLRDRVELTSEVFDKYGELIRSAIRVNLSDYSKADDVYQNLFLSLVHKPMPPYVRDIKSYLNQAVCHDIVDLAKSTNMYRERLCRYWKHHRQIPKIRKPQDILIEKEGFEQLFGLIEKLISTPENKAIIQRYRCGMDVSEAAKEMDVDKRSCSRYTSVALKKIRGFFNETKNRDYNA